MSNSNKIKVLVIILLLGGLLGYSTIYQPPLEETNVEEVVEEKVDYYGRHGKVIAVNDVVFRSESGQRRQKFALLKIGEDKIYGVVEGYNGIETRTNEPNNRYFIRITTQQVNGEDVVVRSTLLVYLDKEDWELFSPVHKEHFVTEK